MVFPLKRKREAATGFALSASRRDSRAHFCAYPESNVPFSCAEEKYHRPCYGKQGKTCFSSKRKEEHSFSKGKRKGRSFCDVTKGTKNTEKERGDSPSLFKPNPFDKWGQSKLFGMRKVSSSCRKERKQKAIVCLRRDKCSLQKRKRLSSKKGDFEVFTDFA